MYYLVVLCLHCDFTQMDFLQKYEYVYMRIYVFSKAKLFPPRRQLSDLITILCMPVHYLIALYLLYM